MPFLSAIAQVETWCRTNNWTLILKFMGFAIRRGQNRVAKPGVQQECDDGEENRLSHSRHQTRASVVIHCHGRITQFRGFYVACD